MKHLSIGEVARRTGIRPSAVRYYEATGILPEPARVNGRRRYDQSVIRRIEVLRFAQQAGFTLAEIKPLFSRIDGGTPLSARWRTLVHAKLEDLAALAKRVRRQRHALELSLECGCDRIEDCSLSRGVVTDVNGRRAGRPC